ncbi:hypothetical protein ABEB36_008967 [Hypothenemus hampei]|uniref:Protein kintoun n=1 Tax=Hypothenemus hampei TaxID=57062 RepID=A0ABD1EP74_HYPHA
MASSFDRLKDLNLSRDEVNRLGEALKKEEFRKLLVDYVEEIQDPKNRQIYEEEVKQLERERGQEVTFLHPTPAYVIKTSVNGDQKCFVNICSNENVQKPTSIPTIKDGSRGLEWSLPHSLSPPHEDLDKKGARCQVYDVLFHPNTLYMGSKNQDFRSIINSIALNAIEANFNVHLDQKNLKFPNMKYKGIKRASIIRKSSNSKSLERTTEEQELFNRIYSEIDSQRVSNSNHNSKKDSNSKRSNEDPKYATPNYLIKHRSHIDIQEFTEDKNAKLNAATPKELIVEVDLPLLKSSSDMDLDVTEKTIQLISERPAKYKLNLTLPYQVNENNGTAKFDKDLKKLFITLPVKRKCAFEPLRYDSGVESCFESDLNSPTSLESDDVNSEHKTIEDINEKKLSACFTQPPIDGFLNAEDVYNLPEFTCNLFDNVIAFTLNVKNVDENTVKKSVTLKNSLVKVKFSNLSPSFYPTLYAFYVKFPKHEVIEEGVTTETWDNNVIVQIALKATTQPLHSYLYGLSEENLTETFIENPAILCKALEEKRNEEQEIKIAEIEPVKTEKPKVQEREPKRVQLLQNTSSAIDILATSYESSGDELSASSFSPRKGKGILKRIPDMRSKFGRSVSESSLDEFISSSYENYHGSIDCVPEDSKEEDGISSSFKKTVRFNNVVVKQLFRSNSSILGQKKKNQRKARNKKRAHERRFSESEASDVESKKERDDQTQNLVQGEKVPKDPGEEPDKKEDTDIFHLEINN